MNKRGQSALLQRCGGSLCRPIEGDLLGRRRHPVNKVYVGRIGQVDQRAAVDTEVEISWPGRPGLQLAIDVLGMSAADDSDIHSEAGEQLDLLRCVGARVGDRGAIPVKCDRLGRRCNASGHTSRQGSAQRGVPNAVIAPILRLQQRFGEDVVKGAEGELHTDSVTIVMVILRHKPLAVTGSRLQREGCGAHVRRPPATAHRAHRAALVSDAAAGIRWHRAGRDSAG